MPLGGGRRVAIQIGGVHYEGESTNGTGHQQARPELRSPESSIGDFPATEHLEQKRPHHVFGKKRNTKVVLRLYIPVESEHNRVIDRSDTYWMALSSSRQQLWQAICMDGSVQLPLVCLHTVCTQCQQQPSLLTADNTRVGHCRQTC